LNIWIGIAVNSLLSHSKFTNGNSLLKGDGGRNAMKLSAPIVMIGAVLADRARKTENEARQDAARRIGQHVILRDLPSRRTETVGRLANRLGHGAQRLAASHDDDRQDQQREREPGGQELWPRSELVNEEAEREQP
jgi:hypothetical protein